MPDMFSAVPLFIGLVFVLVIGGIIFAVIKGISTWAWNNQQPLQTVPAKLVSKRTDTSGMGSGVDTGTSGRVSTSYYVTFELGGERKEFGISGREYGLLAEGDSGTLTSQGTRYKGFARSAWHSSEYFSLRPAIKFRLLQPQLQQQFVARYGMMTGNICQDTRKGSDTQGIMKWDRDMMFAALLGGQAK